ncbi:chorismate lyase [Shewanella algae]|uniref:chorismate--pyruvate lyase family protein n=1 Tax=Shewanella algae TaxID=38313 RepID=UPI001AADC84D|nr:chorismate lyase [Shewanella algae]MBO2559139.1 chorismate lyase [Shewanella algae]
MSVTSLSFPYGESIQWFSPEQSQRLPAAPLHDWLLATGSLTKRLKSCCNHFEVKLLGEAMLPSSTREWQGKEYKAIWIREVLLCLDGTPWVFGRTLIPAKLLEQQQRLGKLGTRPLGELLFGDIGFEPGAIEVASFDSQSRIASLADSLSQPTTEAIWGRRRYFHFQEQQLIVGEIFLPAAVAAINQGPLAP